MPKPTTINATVLGNPLAEALEGGACDSFVFQKTQDGRFHAQLVANGASHMTTTADPCGALVGVLGARDAMSKRTTHPEQN